MLEITNLDNAALATLLGYDGNDVIEEIMNGDVVDMDEDTLALFSYEQLNRLFTEIGADGDWRAETTETWRRATGHSLPVYGKDDNNGYHDAIMERQDRSALDAGGY